MIWRMFLVSLGGLLALEAKALVLPLPAEGENVVGSVQVIEARHEDTFADLGDRYGLGYLEMLAANQGVDPWLPGEGTPLVLPTRFILPPGPREGIVINLAEYRLYYYPKGEDVVYTYPVGIGREGWGSPLGETRITSKIENPSWYPPASIRAEHAADGDPLPTVVGPGPDNPLGPYKMNLALPGYLIHGTNKQFGIGMRVSHGCFRMQNPDITELFAKVPLATPVRIINQPYKLGVAEGRLWLEAHTPLEEDGSPSMADKNQTLLTLLQENQAMTEHLRPDWAAMRDVITAESGMPAEVAARPAGY